MISVAQTNIQLYNQLRGRQMAFEELLLVHRAYELATTLYPAHFQADGKPFVAHGVGVASILAGLDQPAEIIAVGLLHNVYGNADFGDGRGPGPTPRRRRVVRDAVGQRVEQLVTRFGELRAQFRPIDETLAELPRRDDTERRLILVDLADYLEKHVDLGALYGRGKLRAELARVQSTMTELALAIDSRLAGWLAATLEAVDKERDAVPAALSPSDGRDYLTLVAPRSYSRRMPVALRASTRALRDRTQVRTRLRKLLGR
jgi:(p)ppGpp synthase/HD superfamily hydrolase